MTVAAYVDPRPEPWPVRRTVTCRECEPHAGLWRDCRFCGNSREETDDDWGPCVSGSFSASTMTATLRTLGLAVDPTGETRDSFALSALVAALHVMYSTTDDTTADLEEATRYLAGLSLRRADTPTQRCVRELLRWTIELLRTPGVDVATARVYIA